MKPSEEIKKIRHEIDGLNRQKESIQDKISKKKERLETLLTITDNQIDMNDVDGFNNDNPQKKQQCKNP